MAFFNGIFMSYTTKAKLINQFFGVYGYGHFDITTEEFAKILKYIEKTNAKEWLKKFYEKLAKQRLG